MILRRTTTSLWDNGKLIARANVWTEKGHSTKTFSTPAEADRWVPASEKAKPLGEVPK